MQFCMAFIRSICMKQQLWSLGHTTNVDPSILLQNRIWWTAHVLIRIFMFSCRWRRCMWAISCLVFIFHLNSGFCLLCIFQVEFWLSLFCIFCILAWRWCFGDVHFFVVVACLSIFICFENVFICHSFACKGSGQNTLCSFFVCVRIRWNADLFLVTYFSFDSLVKILTFTNFGIGHFLFDAYVFMFYA